MEVADPGVWWNKKEIQFSFILCHKSEISNMLYNKLIITYLMFTKAMGYECVFINEHENSVVTMEIVVWQKPNIPFLVSPRCFNLIA